MKLGFIGFGEVAQTLSNGLIDHGLKVLTCTDGRVINQQNQQNQLVFIYVQLIQNLQNPVIYCYQLLSLLETVNVAKVIGEKF